jgi:acetate kinase
VTTLVLNPGSSTLKFGVYDLTITALGSPGVIEDCTRSMGEATAEVIRRVNAESIHAVGCRVVHGGPAFVEPTIVDDAVLDAIRVLSDLAPIHNRLSAQVIDQVRKSLRGVPVVAVFDTSFHQTLPPVASAYALPAELGIRRYGFHGISYSYVSKRLRALGRDGRAVVCHLGNGASVCAIRDGKSVDTSMGLTPMEGLVMGTRAGDLDPGIILLLMRRGMSEADIDELINHRSGLLALSALSSDLRDLEPAAARGNERAELALAVFAYRVAKYVGAYAVALGGLDTLVFTAGIGEHSSAMRSRISAYLGFLGVELDPGLGGALKGERLLSSGPVEVWVIPTNEELEIAAATEVALRQNRRGGASPASSAGEGS